jgi:DNA modification methylase
VRCEVIGNATLYLGDCLEILPTLGKVDAVVTDPPYGIGADEVASKNKGKHGWKYYGETKWDRSRPTQAVFDAILAAADDVVIWGGNYFADMLPPSMGWLAWDKCQRNFSLADFEMAWTSKNGAARCIEHPRAHANREDKRHPTQKPIYVMDRCIDYLDHGARRSLQLIADPFMGSGTTGVACMNLGRKFIGIEIEPKYFEIACERIENAQRQQRLFA